jgi:small subunit ribosomal protein S9
MAKATETMTYHTGVGTRKTAIAQVRVYQTGTGQWSVNGVKSSAHPLWNSVMQMVGRQDNSDVSIVVRGGGMMSQIEAAAVGLARALVAIDPSYKATLRKAGFITIDPRVKERKKPGLKRARKAPQWSKR